jgi:hypothetical protein
VPRLLPRHAGPVLGTAEEKYVKSRIATIFALAITALASSPLSHAQPRNAKAATPFRPKVFYYHPPRPPMTPEAMDLVISQAASAQTIALWNYSTVAQDGKTYTGMMVGRSPFAHGHRSTTIPTYLVPVILTFQDTGDVFDPTIYDGCGPASESVITLIKNSPLIQTPNFTINGVNLGAGQYLDQFQRASFWAKVGGTPYHTTFGTNPTVLPAVHLTVPAAYGLTVRASTFSGCKDMGEMDINWWDNELQTVIFPSLAAEGVGPANFPQFIFDSVAEYDNGNPSDCCALGYHNAFLNGGVFQTYSVNEYDTSGAFGGDTSVMSHEMAEWLDDPNGSNPVPAWGAEGQVTAGNCQANLEVGDPLSPGFGTATKPLSFKNTTTGVTYTLQELAFYSWFLGSKPSLGAGGKYSDNGTFSGYSKACPPGGTN